VFNSAGADYNAQLEEMHSGESISLTTDKQPQQGHPFGAAGHGVAVDA